MPAPGMTSPTSWSHADHVPEDIVGQTVADAMLHKPKTVTPGFDVAHLHAFFEDEHVHAALVLDAAGQLLSVVTRGDLEGHEADVPVAALGCLEGRVVSPDADLARTWQAMVGGHLRRLAVTDPDDGTLLGLLCLNRSRLGFCSDSNVAERASSTPDI
jgi:CBS domain-containing protein